ncbi:MAG: Ni/Fe hydrogenase subunit alpha [Candidatus Nanopelagicales bacterium]|nr:Ni/Fe hydrogenase subunit alpha [Candidatus Nanopelagicales bacterium]MCU0297504.1 Ni/Fe hydrogenase subunit alpha [Candidatus Nanopelagicales bacterium]
MTSRTVKVGMLARVEGEGAMLVDVRDGNVEDVQLRIFEPPRFFEGFLRGRDYRELPDITARICGICPVAYQLSACLAIEDACGVEVSEEIRLMRRLLYCGEWIESHALHIFFLHAPDFLGFDGAIEMAREHRGVVEAALRIKRAGNELMGVVGGRSVHPINVKVGGFHRMPTGQELRAVRPALIAARDEVLELLPLLAGFEFPEFEQPHLYLALGAENGYPLETGSLVSSDGLQTSVSAFGDHVREQHVEHSNALHAQFDGHRYMVGPLARYSLHSRALSTLATQAALAVGLGEVCRNPFKSILVRAVELVFALDEAVRIIDGWQGTAAAAVPVTMLGGQGHGATEAPRGLLYHRYRFDADGSILDAQIVPPTSQNQPSIEDDLRIFVQDRLDLAHDELTRQCETVIRNYDPCISCATHFLDLRIERR